MWGIIKSSVNSDIGRPLNEQGYGLRTYFLRSGGPLGETIMEDVLRIDGSGFLTNFTFVENGSANIGGSVREIIADGEVVFRTEMHPTSTSSIEFHAQHGYRHRAGVGTQIATDPFLFPPIYFNQQLVVRFLKQNIAPSAQIPVIRADVVVHTSAAVQQSSRTATSHRLVTDTNQVITLPTNIVDDTIRLLMVGAGGWGRARRSTTASGAGGPAGEVVDELVQGVAGSVVTITIGTSGTLSEIGTGNWVPSLPPIGAPNTTASFNPGSSFVAIGQRGTLNPTNYPQPGERPEPWYLLSPRGAGGNGRHNTDTSNSSTLGQHGRVIIEYEVE